MNIRDIGSVVLILIAIGLSFALFYASISEDIFIHELRDNYHGAESSGGFEGLRGMVTDTAQKITSTYGNTPIVYEKLEHQTYVRSGKNSHWRTDLVTTKSTEFTFVAQGKTFQVLTADSYFPMQYTVQAYSGNTRKLQSIIPANKEVYVYGDVTQGQIRPYLDPHLGYRVFLVTDDLGGYIKTSVSNILMGQFVAGAVFLVLGILLFGLNYWRRAETVFTVTK